MTYDQARREFLEMKTNGKDPIIVRLNTGPVKGKTDPADFVVRDRKQEIAKEAKQWQLTPTSMKA